MSRARSNSPKRDSRRAQQQELPPPTQLIHNAIASNASHRGADIALLSQSEQLTYDALNKRANQIAHALTELAAVNNEVVAVCAEPGGALVAALLGIMKAGGAYLPLSPTDPPARLETIILASGARVLLAGRASAQKLAGFTGTVLLIDEPTFGHFERFPEHNPPVINDDGRIAYVIYTSGSTGTPKGVMVTHANLSNYLEWSAVAFDVSASTRGLVMTSIAFDATVTSLWTPLFKGGSAYLMEAADLGYSQVPTLLGNADQQYLVKLTPSQLRLIAPALEAVQNIHPNTHLVIGGEQLQKSDVENIIKSARIRCTNHFGPTEATVGCIAHELSLADLTHDRLPIGRPITNVSAVLLDEKFNPVPTGAIGELYVLGACVTNGYLNRPDLTAQRYIRSPIANGKRMYRTGDLARVRTDGLFECHGRSDRQVKIDGYRIELDEVEQYIREIPGVRAAAVVSRADGDGRARLLAYFVAANEAMLTPPAVYSALKQSLPQYMVPAAIHMLKQFPLTRNGKVDLDALPEPAAESLSESPSRAESPDASQLAQIWMEVLGCGPIAPEDNFFEIGGHSLAAIRTMARVREHFSRGIPLAAIFEHPTLEGLRRYLEAYMASATTSPV